MEQKKLVCELTNLINLKKQEFKYKEAKKKSEYKTEFAHGASVLQSADINERYLSTEQKAEIVALYQFIIDNKLTNEEISELLQQKVEQFKNYRQIIKRYPDFIDELKKHGPVYFMGRIGYDKYMVARDKRKL